MVAELVVVVALADADSVPWVPVEFVGEEYVVAAVAALMAVVAVPPVVGVAERFDIGPLAVPFVAVAVVAAAELEPAFGLVGFFSSSFRYCVLIVAGVASEWMHHYTH